MLQVQTIFYLLSKKTNNSSQARAHGKCKCNHLIDVIVTCAYLRLRMSQSVSLPSTLRSGREQHICSARAMLLVGRAAASDFGNEALSIEITSILVPKGEAPTPTRTVNGNHSNVTSRAQSEQIAAGHIALLGFHLCRFCEQCISYCCLSTYSSAQYFLQNTLLLNARMSLSCSLSFCSKLLIEHLSSFERFEFIALLLNIIARAGNTFTSDTGVKSGAHSKTIGTAELRDATPRRSRLARQTYEYTRNSSGEGAALADMWQLDFDSSSGMLIDTDVFVACLLQLIKKHCRNVLLLY